MELHEAKRLVQTWLQSTSGTLRTLVARSSLCLTRSSFDPGIGALLPKLRADIAAHALAEPQNRSFCT